MQIQGKFGAITICPPDRPPTAADEERLYSALMECLLVRPEKDCPAGKDKGRRPGRAEGPGENTGQLVL